MIKTGLFITWETQVPIYRQNRNSRAFSGLSQDDLVPLMTYPLLASAAPKAGEKRYLFWRSLTSCTGKASWCSPTPENLRARSADLASDPQPGQPQNLQDFLWATLCLSLCCGKCGCPKASQACRRISAIS